MSSTRMIVSKPSSQFASLESSVFPSVLLCLWQHSQLSSTQDTKPTTMMVQMMNVPSRKHCWSFFTLTHLIFSLLILSRTCHASDNTLDGRFSFSLTTFDPTGKLRQVERAQQAASLGTPLVAVCFSNKILMACPQVLPSPFMTDDGTARFNRITQNIAVAHSGVSADGRVVIASAQRMAVEHAYTFDEPIPIESFLEGVSLLFQEYTMKPASRPFGCNLLVAHVPSKEESDDATPRIYRIDPSGSVETMDTFAVIGSLQNKASLTEALDRFAKDSSGSQEKDEATLMRILDDSVVRPPLTSLEKSEKMEPRRNYLVASLTKQNGLQVRRERQPIPSTSSSESKA